jgi:hypothetical protein
MNPRPIPALTAFVRALFTREELQLEALGWSFTGLRLEPCPDDSGDEQWCEVWERGADGERVLFPLEDLTP